MMCPYSDSALTHSTTEKREFLVMTNYLHKESQRIAGVIGEGEGTKFAAGTRARKNLVSSIESAQNLSREVNSRAKKKQESL